MSNILAINFMIFMDKLYLTKNRERIIMVIFYVKTHIVPKSNSKVRFHTFLFISQFIYQEYYKVSSAVEQGTLFQLRNIIHRVDVIGGDGAVDKFR